MPDYGGRLVVASPALRDPNFERTVVLVVEHGDEGAVGVILNRPSESAVSEILPIWEHLAAQPSVVFLGGPVAQNGVICLGRSGPGGTTGAGAGWRPLFGGLGSVDLDTDPDDLGPSGPQSGVSGPSGPQSGVPGPGGPGTVVGGIRLFAGHAGWGPGQLEGEVEAGAWFVLEALADDAVVSAPEDLWPMVLRRQGGALARVANFPDDPSAN